MFDDTFKSAISDLKKVAPKKVPEVFFVTLREMFEKSLENGEDHTAAKALASRFKPRGDRILSV